MTRYLLILAVFVLVSPFGFSQRSKAPAAEDKVRNYVTDKTGTLTQSQIQTLDTKVSNFEKETSNQVIVWMIPSLDGGSLEEKSYEIAEQNGIGQKEKDNGVLLFIAKNDKKLRIEVGYGLEGVLTDALSDQIIRKEITPHFKQGKFYEGINSGVDAIIKATKGEYTVDKKSENDGSGTVCCGLPLFVFVMIFILIVVFGIPILSAIFGWGRSGRSNWWHTGGSSGSGSSWSSGGSSGFSGGGGSFGGGGASGSW